MELKRINFINIHELLGKYDCTTVRNPIPYDIGDLKKLLMMIGKNICGEHFTIDDNNRSVYESVFKWCNGDKDFTALDPMTKATIPGSIDKGLYIAGPTGSGKTMLTKIFGRYLSLVGVTLTSPSGITIPLSWKSYQAGEICDYYAKNGEIDMFLDNPSLCIQDIGSEPKETVYMGNRRGVIEYLLQTRGDKESGFTIITSNDMISENKYGDRVTSRLIAKCNYFELKGKDRRRL